MNHNMNTTRNGWSSTRRISGPTEISTEIAATVGQKRSRTTQRSSYGNINCRSFSLGLVAALATIVLFPAPSQGFQFRQAIWSSTLDSGRSTCYIPDNLNRPFSHQNRLAALHSTRSPSKSSNSNTAGGVVVEAMQPLRSDSLDSKKRRETVMRNAERDADARLVDTALEGIDAQVLELLMSEEFLYPSAEESPKRDKRVIPNGRPASVPGAMTWKSMKKFEQRRGLMMDILEKNGLNAAGTEFIRQDLETKIGVRSEEVSKKEEQVNRTRGRKSKVAEDVLPEAAAAVTNESTKSKKKAKRKKRVVKKYLPSRRKVSIPYADSEMDLPSTDDFIKSRSRPGKSRIPGNTYRRKESINAELRRYFDSELLTGEEEYILGEKIQHSVQFEEVHEGLCLEEMRLPTIAEWAAACGYTEEQEGEHVVSDILEKKIRPSGFDEIFRKVDPNTFVGNGLASTVGVGRGRGRQKSPPPSKIPKDLYKMDRNTGKKIGGAEAKPINRGTVEDFCNKMVEGRDAKQLMIQSNMRLVISISKKYSKVGVSLYDLVQEGSVGLSRAAEKFDPTKGFKFSTYASWWIQQAVFRSIAYHSRTIRLPVHIHNMLNRIRKVKASLQQGLGRYPTDEEMAEALDMPISKYERMMKLTKRSVSLESKQYKQNPKDFGLEGEDSIGDMTSTERQFDNNLDEENISPEKSVDRSLFRDDLEEMLLSLEEGEQTVIRLRYGIADGLTRTVTATAAKLNQTPAWVRSQESKALRKLRRPWYEKKLKDHQMSLLG